MMRLVSFFLLMIPFTLSAQFTYTLDQATPVHDLEGKSLRLPWAGGLNAAQFNTMDLNGDGTDDLVLYDRMANKIITFVAADNQYVAAPEYEGLFPSEVYNWILLRDFNCDGKKDIFTGDVLGMKVFINKTSAPGALEWEPYLFPTGFDGPKSTVLLTRNPATSIKVNLQIQYDDLPAIADVDGDGDLDILNIQYAGHTVEFHQNLTKENYGSCDSLEFVRVTRSWGSFRECDCGTFAFNNAPCPPNSGGRIKHAGGKSLVTLDLNGDGQQDVLFSESECTQLYALTNKGTAANPVIDNFSAFPQTNPVNFVLFPAAFYEDVDFDGRKDLISTPNIFSKEYLNSQLNHSTWFYKNTGTNDHPSFNLVEHNFLQSEMIDVGDNAIPAFVDFNGDGLLDLVISSHSSAGFTSRLFLYRNNGSATRPSFGLISDDYLGFSAARYYNVKIQFADMDGNKTKDLVFTATSFDNGSTNLYYLTNMSEHSLEFNGGTLRQVGFSLTSSENIHVADINGDGLPDILAGRSEGNLEYWRNNGTASSPSFVLENDSYLGFNSSTLRQNLAVAVADLDGDGQQDLVFGDQSGAAGIISAFTSISEDPAPIEYNFVFNPLLEIYHEKNFGGKAWPVVVDLFGSTRPTIVIGNSLGGLHLLRHDLGTSLPEPPEVDIYPNPVSKAEELSIRADRHGIAEIYSILGHRVSTPLVLKANELVGYRVSSLAAGLYLLKFTSNDKSHAFRFIVR